MRTRAFALVTAVIMMVAMFASPPAAMASGNGNGQDRQEQGQSGDHRNDQENKDKDDNRGGDNHNGQNRDDEQKDNESSSDEHGESEDRGQSGEHRNDNSKQDDTSSDEDDGHGHDNDSKEDDTSDDGHDDRGKKDDEQPKGDDPEYPSTPPPADEQHPSKDGPSEGQQRVTYCHAKPADTAKNGWNLLTTSVAAFFQSGHPNHAADIVAPFTYVKNGQEIYFPGMNWPEGQEILENGCEKPEEPEVIVPPLGLELDADCYVLTATISAGDGTTTAPYEIHWPNGVIGVGSLEPNTSETLFIDITPDLWGETVFVALTLGDGIKKGGSEEITIPDEAECEPTVPVEPPLTLDASADCNYITAVVETGDGDVRVGYSLEWPDGTVEYGDLGPNEKATFTKMVVALWYGTEVNLILSVGDGDNAAVKVVEIPTCESPVEDADAHIVFDTVCDNNQGELVLANTGDVERIFTYTFEEQVEQTGDTAIGSALAAIKVAPNSTERVPFTLTYGVPTKIIINVDLEGAETVTKTVTAERCPDEVELVPNTSASINSLACGSSATTAVAENKGTGPSSTFVRMDGVQQGETATIAAGATKTFNVSIPEDGQAHLVEVVADGKVVASTNLTHTPQGECGSLPVTGSSTMMMLLIAAGLIGAGTWLHRIGRRRELAMIPARS